MNGIYRIRNIKNNKCYIGESLNISERWTEHIKQLDSNSHENYKLQSDYNLYGRENFEFSIIGFLDDNIVEKEDIVIMKILLLIYESKFIARFDSVNNGYNNEYTIKRILSGDKKVSIGDDENGMSVEKFNIFMKNIRKKIKSKNIIEENGIIKYNLYPIKDLLKKYKVNRNELKKILLSLGVLKDKTKITLSNINHNDLSEEDIIETEGSSKLYLSHKLFKFICDKIDQIDVIKELRTIEAMERECRRKSVNGDSNNIYDKLIEVKYKEEKNEPKKDIDNVKKSNKENNNIVEVLKSEGFVKFKKQEKNAEVEELDVNKEYKFIESTSFNEEDSFKKFISNNYKLHATYNDIIKFMRFKGVLKRVKYGDRFINIPTEKYEKIFYFFINEDNILKGGILIRDEYKDIIVKALKKVNLLSDIK